MPKRTWHRDEDIKHRRLQADRADGAVIAASSEELQGDINGHFSEEEMKNGLALKILAYLGAISAVEKAPHVADTLFARKFKLSISKAYISRLQAIGLDAFEGPASGGFVPIHIGARSVHEFLILQKPLLDKIETFMSSFNPQPALMEQWSQRDQPDSILMSQDLIDSIRTVTKTIEEKGWKPPARAGRTDHPRIAQTSTPDGQGRA